HRQAYDAWFASDRVKVHDRCLIQEMLLDTQGYVFGSNPQDVPQLNDALLMSFGQLPLGGHYMNQAGARRPTDIFYHAVDDRSNANFLWFIKFERSFLQKERQLYED